MSRNRELADLIAGGFTEADIPNLSAGKITSGTFADARLSQSSVQQYASTFDDNKIVNDISTLGLRVHTQENLNASNTNSASFDVFQDSSGITNLTNVIRETGEYVSSVSNNMPTGTELYLKSNSASNNSTSIQDYSGNNVSISFGGGGKHITQNDVPIGATSGVASTSAFWFDGSQKIDATHSTMETPLNFGTGDFTMATYWRTNNVNSNTSFLNMGGIGSVTDYNGMSWDYEQGDNKMAFYYRQGGTTHISAVKSDNMSLSNDTWYHLAVVRQSGQIRFFKNGVKTGSTLGSGQNANYNIDMTSADSRPFNIGIKSDGTHGFQGRMDAIHIVKGSALYWDNFTAPTVYYGTTANATGSFEGNAITVSSTNKMGAVITYQDNAGTNALNTDIILKLSADNGSNYSTATLTALPDFATGIKMAKVNDLSVTAGTQLKYKLEFANQSAGSKEARIRGVSLQY